MINLVSGEPKFVKLWHDICRKQELDKQEWIEQLRKEGFKAAHPNDGWVDREENSITLVYPQFNDGVKIGDKIMLGWPNGNLRPVRIIGETGMLSKRLLFEDITEPET